MRTNNISSSDCLFTIVMYLVYLDRTSKKCDIQCMTKREARTRNDVLERLLDLDFKVDDTEPIATDAG